MPRDTPARDRKRLEHMLDAARDAVRVVGGRDLAAFRADRDAVAATCHYLAIVGEASAHVSEATQERAPDIPWAVMRGMRNRLIHGYDQVDVAIVHETIVRHLPALIAALERELGG